MIDSARMLVVAAIVSAALASPVKAAPAAPAAKLRGIVGFCEAHPTVDHPTARDGGVPPELAAIGADRWRCLDGQVLVCQDSADADQCARKADDRRPRIVAEACRAAGDSPDVPFYAGHPYRYDWACRRGQPVVIRAYALDRRGFFRKAWARLVVRNGVVVAPKAAPNVVR